jgi:hypothetical protein
MKWFLEVGMLIGACACLANAGPAQAQAPRQPTAQCLYSGPVAIGRAYDDPIRFDIDADGRGLKFIHKVQTNFEMNNPFKPPILAEKPTCRLKLDCMVSTQGLENIGVQTTNAGTGMTDDRNAWTRVGFSVAFKYDNEVRNMTCHVVGIESL